MKRQRSLLKYYGERRWAEAFLDGNLLFRSLAYFRDCEDAGVRGDSNEGTTLFRPKGGLVANPDTAPVPLPAYTFTSAAKQDEIFVFSLSRALTARMQEEFAAACAVEILDIAAFCRRIEAAVPSHASFPGRPGRRRIGQRVEYYAAEDSLGARWALPNLVAASKLDGYAWQDEFRLVFSLTDALGFEKVGVHLVPDGTPAPAPNSAEHHAYLLQAASLRDICRLHDLAKQDRAGDR